MHLYADNLHSSLRCMGTSEHKETVPTIKDLNNHLQEEPETWTIEFVELGGETYLLASQVRLLRKVRLVFVNCCSL